MLTLLILLVIVAAVAFWGVGIYNGLVTARNAFKNAFAQIDVQLQRRPRPARAIRRRWRSWSPRKGS